MTVTTKQGKKQRREKDKIIIRHERRGPFKTETRWETRLQRSCLERTRREGSGIFARANIMKEKKGRGKGRGERNIVGEGLWEGGIIPRRFYTFSWFLPARNLSFFYLIFSSYFFDFFICFLLIFFLISFHFTVWSWWSSCSCLPGRRGKVIWIGISHGRE